MMELSGTKQILTFIQEDWKLLAVLTSLFAMYFYYTSTFDFFQKKGIPYMKPIIFLGNLGPRILSKKSFHQFQLDIYNYFKGKPFGGMFEGRRPALYVFDPEIIKAVTIRDFENFADRLSLSTNEPRYLNRFLLNLKGSEWKGVRSAITPAFSSSRLKNMFPLIETCTQQMVEFLKQYDKKDVEMKDTMGRFTLEVIGACAFGIKSDALNDENAHFVKVAEKFNFMPKSKRFFIFFLLMFMPKLFFKYLNFSFLNRESIDELMRMLKATKEERRSSGLRKNDFLQLLIETAEKEKTDSENTKSKTYMDDDTIDAQSLLFLIAGYETSSTLLSFAIHMLAIKPDLQEDLRKNIIELTKDTEINYELLSQLHYLEGFLLETLRMYPPVARIDRVCTKKYQIPSTSITLNVGDVVSIPVYGIHMDPDFYPAPLEFKPERFMNEDKSSYRPSHLFLAFGAGPRNCIGLRFAMTTAKMAMVSLLKNFKFSICSKTENPIQFDKKTMLLKANSGLWVRIDSL